ncbi:ATP-binding protein [Cerasicoccus frondis]|uniref:ATP-binding protein n=1 Tax=Cerasicoccus frondis TaxID=490090 RepID=UPI0028527D62|nr:ATP-binding protein [Cerasicoccus frondis]
MSAGEKCVPKNFNNNIKHTQHMAVSLKNITKGATIRAPRIIILGVEKIGKTTFACGSRFENGQIAETGINAPIVIPTKGEEGADSLDVASFPTMMNYNSVMEAIGSLYTEEHEYRTAVLDSASALEPLIWDAVCSANNVNGIEDVGGGYGKGYTEALGLWRQLLEGLDALRAAKNMASVIIGHVKVKRFDDPAGDSYDQYTFDINDKAANLLFRWADVILFCNTKVVVKKEDKGFGQKKAQGIDLTGGARFLFTQKRPAHPGGGRGAYGQLPYELPLDWAEFEQAVASVAQ